MNNINALKAYFDNNLATVETSTKVFRAGFLRNAVEMGYTVASAASAYNGLVHEAIEAGRVRKVRLGVLELADKPEMAWAIVNKETRAIEGWAPSKNQGYKAKTEGQTVVKASTLA